MERIQMSYGISIDVGTSGTRMHAVDLSDNKIVSTAITVRHPVPGANVMDHLTFCIQVDRGIAHRLLIDTSNKLMKMLEIDLNKVERVAICGNPIQLSMFHIEGQSIKAGMLASPGAISDVNSDGYWRCTVLDDAITAQNGDLIEPNTGSVVEPGPMHGRALGVTGTGVIAAIAVAMEYGLIKWPHITTADRKLHLQDGITLTEHDVLEAAKTFGAMRAGHFTLLEHAGLMFDQLDVMYMSGASGTYVDALKAQRVGLLPPTPKKIYQFGNTSLAMATDLVKDPELLDHLQTLANSIRANHVMFASDPIFEKVFVQELAYWQEGMPMDMYNMMLEMAEIQPLPSEIRPAEVIRVVKRDIPDLGSKGLKVLRDIGVHLSGSFEGCIGCEACVKECPEHALKVSQAGDGFELEVSSDLCNGTACMRCERACPEKVYRFNELHKGLVNAG